LNLAQARIEKLTENNAAQSELEALHQQEIQLLQKQIETHPMVSSMQAKVLELEARVKQHQLDQTL
jgi:hypothetical protein